VSVRGKIPLEAEGEEHSCEGDSRWQLAERVAHSAALSRAAQLRAILLYIVRHAIQHPEEPVHEVEIAQRVLGRRSDFNPMDDNIVRVQIAHLRKKLDLYFSAEGKDEEVVITIAMGSYMPVFTVRAQVLPAPLAAPAMEIVSRPRVVSLEGAIVVAPGDQPPDTAPGIPPPSARRGWMLAAWIGAGLVVIGLATACIALWVQNRDLERSFYPWKYEPAVAAFWSGYLGAHRNTDIVMSDSFFKLAQDITKRPFTLNDYIDRNYINQLLQHEKEADTLEIIGKVDAWRSSNGNHLKLAERILALDPLGKSIHLYYSRDYRPDLIDQDNVILLGSRLTNPWDDLIDGHMNFVAQFNSNNVTAIINRAPAAGEQTVYTHTDSIGYCVVAYLPNPGHNGNTLLIEGTSVESTEAGGDFLLSENQLANFQRRLRATSFPYFEVLLKTSQVSGTPFTANIEAYRVYPNLH